MEVYPGNTADVVAMEKMINRLRKRLAIRDVVVVACPRCHVCNRTTHAFLVDRGHMVKYADK
jgi:hypothetical protein